MAVTSHLIPGYFFFFFKEEFENVNDTRGHKTNDLLCVDLWGREQQTGCRGFERHKLLMRFVDNNKSIEYCQPYP